jgi:hypothetical protein
MAGDMRLVQIGSTGGQAVKPPEFHVANSIDFHETWRAIVPLAAIASIERHARLDRAEKDVATA